MKRVVLLVTLFVCGFAIESAAQNATFVPGQSYFGRNQYIEYIAGNSPYIVSGPHGGDLTPSEIPDRTSGETVTDSNIMELSRAISAAVFAREGRYPHIIICHLKRTKLDANRDLSEALEGNNPYAIQAWKEFQSFIDTAKKAIIRDFGKGFYVDIHGHGHAIQRLELGYLLSAASLALSDNALNSPAYGNASSIRSMIPLAKLSFPQLLRGPQSFGSYFESHGFPAVPSQAQPNPGTAPYFSGGYNTQRHGSSNGGPISGVQIECNFTGVRDTDNSRRLFAEAFSEVIKLFTSTLLFVTGIDERTTASVQYQLSQNYPNPFNPRTAISFQLTAISFVRLKVFDALGREVATLVEAEQNAGSHTVMWDAQNLPSGVYVYRIVTGTYTDSKRMLLVK